MCEIRRSGRLQRTPAGAREALSNCCLKGGGWKVLLLLFHYLVLSNLSVHAGLRFSSYYTSSHLREFFIVHPRLASYPINWDCWQRHRRLFG